MSRPRLVAWLPALAYMLLIWVLSSMSQPFKVDFVPFRDKGAHFVEYGTLAALLAHAMRGNWPDWRFRGVFFASWSVTVVWGLLDEIHQAFVPGRVADVRDLLADAIGGLLGAVIYLAVRSPQRLTPP
jgi:VanZ family protein